MQNITFLDKKDVIENYHIFFYWQELPEIAFELLFSHAWPSPPEEERPQNPAWLSYKYNCIIYN